MTRLAPLDGVAGPRRFDVRLSDIDANNHANSACYFDWFIEALPPDLLPAALDAALDAALAIGDEYSQAFALSGLAPHLPPSWRALRFAIRWRTRRHHEIEQEKVQADIERNPHHARAGEGAVY